MIPTHGSKALPFVRNPVEAAVRVGHLDYCYTLLCNPTAGCSLIMLELSVYEKRWHVAGFPAMQCTCCLSLKTYSTASFAFHLFSYIIVKHLIGDKCLILTPTVHQADVYLIWFAQDKPHLTKGPCFPQKIDL